VERENTYEENLLLRIINTYKGKGKVVPMLNYAPSHEDVSLA